MLFIGSLLFSLEVLSIIIFMYIYIYTCPNRYTLAFVFGNVLQRDINEFVHDWNNHLIRRNKHRNVPCGRPADLYDMPGLQGIQSVFCSQYCTLMLICV